MTLLLSFISREYRVDYLLESSSCRDVAVQIYVFILFSQSKYAAERLEEEKKNPPEPAKRTKNLSLDQEAAGPSNLNSSTGRLRAQFWL